MPTLYLLELFSGTGSFAKGVKQALPPGWRLQVHSLDIHPKYNPSTCTDILKWQYRPDVDAFLASRRPSDLVWFHASPPCTEYSRAKTTGTRDLPLADAIVKKTLRVMRYAQADHFTLENPVGLLMQRPFMQKFNRFLHITDYCKFGKPFRKSTCIWTDVPGLDLPRCEKGSYCPTKASTGHHAVTAQSGPTANQPGSGKGENVYPLPKGLTARLVREAFRQRKGKA